MSPSDTLRLVNAGMIGFDLALGTGALLAPATTLRLLGHEPPAPDAEALFRRAGPIWLTFAAAHAVAAPSTSMRVRRDAPRMSRGGTQAAVQSVTLSSRAPATNASRSR